MNNNNNNSENKIEIALPTFKPARVPRHADRMLRVELADILLDRDTEICAYKNKGDTLLYTIIAKPGNSNRWISDECLVELAGMSAKPYTAVADEDIRNVCDLEEQVDTLVSTVSRLDVDIKTKDSWNAQLIESNKLLRKKLQELKAKLDVPPVPKFKLPKPVLPKPDFSGMPPASAFLYDQEITDSETEDEDDEGTILPLSPDPPMSPTYDPLEGGFYHDDCEEGYESQEY